MDAAEQISALKAQLAVYRATLERVAGHFYAESCHHGKDHERADPTFHCCDHAEMVWTIEALEADNYDRALAILNDTFDWEYEIAEAAP